MIHILIGVTGSGKTTLGRKLAEKLEAVFYDADDFHPPANKEKMGRGIALTDEDRLPWLQKLRNVLEEGAPAGTTVVLACSALKQKYRDLLSKGLRVRWIYLKGDQETIRKRLGGRQGHFAGLSLLDSQIETLEEPQGVLVVDIRQTPEEIIRKLVQELKGYS